MKIINFFKESFKSMKESAKLHHEMTKANFEAVKTESKIHWEEAKLSPKQRVALINHDVKEKINLANNRKNVALERLNLVYSIKNNN